MPALDEFHINGGFLFKVTISSYSREYNGYEMECENISDLMYSFSMM